MSTETLKNDYNKDISVSRVNVDILKSRVVEKQKKDKFQYRIAVGSLLISIGLISYFVG